MQRQDLERMTREQLIAHAERLGIPRPRVLTQPELVDEIIGRTSTSERERARARGWLGRARDLLAKVVEKGLHLPEAARVLRQEEKNWPAPPPPLPTVTLAEIYAAQGHLERAITVLDEVLGREPDHREARSLRERFVEQLHRSRARTGRIDPSPPSPPPPPTTREAKTVKAKDATPKAEEPASQATSSDPATTEQASQATSSDDASAAAAEASTERPAALAARRSTDDDGLESTAEEEPTAIDDEAMDTAPDDAILDTERAPAEPLEEPALPARYEVDEVVAIAVDPRTIYLYWEVRPTTLARARAAQPSGEMCVRIASVTASWEGPVVDTRDLHVDALYGDRFVRDVQPGSNVRVSVGWKSAAGFEPLAVGAEVTAPRAVPVETVADDVARWDEAKGAPLPFAAWSPGPGPAAEAHRFDPFVARLAPLAPWARTAVFAPAATHSTHATHGAHAAPIDTGFAIWGEPASGPGDELTEREVVVQEAWFVAGGSSELARGGPARTRTVRVTRLGLSSGGGASELAR